MAALDDAVSNIKNLIQQVSNIGQLLGSAFPQLSGTFTLSTATTTAVGVTGMPGSLFPVLTPINATAALTQRTAGLYVSAVTSGVGFAVSTQTGVPTGTERFFYFVP